MHSRYKPVGWRNDSIRHSLAAKGYRTAFVMNSSKGNFSTEMDPKFVDPKTGKVKDLKKSLQARGFKTTGGREARRVGDTPFVSAPSDDFGFGPMESSLSESDLVPVQSQPIAQQVVEASPVDASPPSFIPDVDYGYNREGLEEVPEVATPGTPPLDPPLEEDRI